MEPFDDYSDPAYTRLVTRMNFYASLLAQQGLEVVRAALCNRLVAVGVSQQYGKNWRIFDKVPLVNDLMVPVTYQSVVDMAKASSNLLVLEANVENKGVLGQDISEQDQPPVFLGLDLRVLDALLSQDFSRIADIRVDTYHLKIELKGKPYIICVSSSGQALPSVSMR